MTNCPKKAIPTLERLKGQESYPNGGSSIIWARNNVLPEGKSLVTLKILSQKSDVEHFWCNVTPISQLQSPNSGFICSKASHVTLAEQLVGSVQYMTVQDWNLTSQDFSFLLSITIASQIQLLCATTVVLAVPDNVEHYSTIPGPFPSLFLV